MRTPASKVLIGDRVRFESAVVELHDSRSTQLDLSLIQPRFRYVYCGVYTLRSATVVTA